MVTLEDFKALQFNTEIKVGDSLDFVSNKDMVILGTEESLLELNNFFNGAIHVINDDIANNSLDLYEKENQLIIVIPKTFTYDNYEKDTLFYTFVNKECLKNNSILDSKVLKINSSSINYLNNSINELQNDITVIDNYIKHKVMDWLYYEDKLESNLSKENLNSLYLLLKDFYKKHRVIGGVEKIELTRIFDNVNKTLKLVNKELNNITLRDYDKFVEFKNILTDTVGLLLKILNKQEIKSK